MKTIKTPEEIVSIYADLASNIALDDNQYCITVQDAAKAMKAYADQLKLTDEEIETDMRESYRSGLFILSETTIAIMVNGAKWYRDELKRMRNECT